MKELSRLVMDYARCQGASAVGIATTETLSGGPPSADLTYVLPEAKAAIIQGVKAYSQRPEMEGGYHHSLMPDMKLWLTCGNCQLICHPDKAVRKERYDMLKQSGAVIQERDGSLKAVSPQDAVVHVESLDKATRSLYIDTQ
ncbi:MAG: hypothetical protein DRH90_10700 [Deltaproteobacteria bacterium]|nr:MAG: hypothetical protein DRH90_10700 [Deltaproteobacteria bacterium]RLC09506.1 MAG: hypothetical protein DRI24_21675 [Deltaproteobacteria bacterium]